MEFTKSQFNKHFKDFYIDDFPGNWDDSDWRFVLFNDLPEDLQGQALQFGCSDTVFRDNAFTYLIKKHFKITTEEFYKHVVPSLK